MDAQCSLRHLVSFLSKTHYFSFFLISRQYQLELKSCECDQVSEKGAEVAETSTIRAVAVRLSAPKPQRGRLWARTRAESVGKEGRGGGSAFGSWSLLVPTRPSSNQGKGGGSEYSLASS